MDEASAHENAASEAQNSGEERVGGPRHIFAS